MYDISIKVFICLFNLINDILFINIWCANIDINLNFI